MRMRIGVAGGPLPFDQAGFTPALVEKLVAHCITAVVTHIPLDPDLLPLARAREIGTLFADAGIEIAQAGGFRTSLIDPDDKRRREGVQRLHGVLEVAQALGARAFITGCGSHHQEFYGPHRANHTQEARDRLVESLLTVAPWAEELGVLFTVEGFNLTTLESPRRVGEILDAVNSPWVRETFDPVNMIGDLASAYDTASAMRAMWDAVGSHYAPCAHAKDVVVDYAAPLHLSQAPPGDGLLDYDVYFEVCKHIGEGMAVIVEHLPEEPALRAVDYVRSRGESNGVDFSPQ